MIDLCKQIQSYIHTFSMWGVHRGQTTKQCDVYAIRKQVIEPQREMQKTNNSHGTSEGLVDVSGSQISAIAFSLLALFAYSEIMRFVRFPAWQLNVKKKIYIYTYTYVQWQFLIWVT